MNRRGLVAHYKYHGNVSALGTWYDISGNGNHGTLVGTPFVDSQGANFNGNNSSYIDSNFMSSNLGSSFSISFWLKSLNSSVYRALLMGNYSAPATTDINIEIYTGKKFRLYIGSDSLYSDNDTVDYNQWMFLTFGKSLTATNITKNSNIIASGVTSKNPTKASNLLIGRDYRTENALLGIIDDIRIYNRALSAAEISQIYHETKGKH